MGGCLSLLKLLRGRFFRSRSKEQRLVRGEGACLAKCKGRCHLPLKGQLGWMTRASGVKTTPDMKPAFGAPGPKLVPHFFVRRDFSSNDYLGNCHSERSVVEESAA